MTGIKTAKARKQRDEAVELLRDGLENADGAWREKVGQFISRFDPARFAAREHAAPPATRETP